jgi:hypothetical protein
MDADRAPDLTVIVISYNTRDLTLAALRTLFETTRETPMHVVVLDNASSDGSADAIADAFPQVELIRSQENLGFARANNVVAENAETEWLLLLNPDTECHEGAVDNLMRFARETPEAGIWGGRTVFPDGSLNIASCWNRITLWSLFCRAIGLSTLFPDSELLNPEAIGGWRRDSVREVDIVVGCFLLIRKELWEELGGFDLRYFMYGEEADLCLRAREMGCGPMITPDAQIMHLVGAASGRAEKMQRVMKARATLIRDHWPSWKVPFGLGLMWLWIAIRRLAVGPIRVARPSSAPATETYETLWRGRAEWLSGY